MSAPQGYPQEGYQEQGQQDGSGYDQGASAPAPAAAKKKRAYAGQAFEFGTGANTAPPAGQQPPPPVGGYGAAPAAGYGYPQQTQPQAAYQQPAYGDQSAQAPVNQQYGQPQYGAQGGYQAPDPSYPAAGVAPAAPGGVAGVTQQFGQMGFNQQQPGQQPQAAPQVAQRLNPLQPVDISPSGQPFHVSDLDLPPPPLILPPNVRIPVP